MIITVILPQSVDYHEILLRSNYYFGSKNRCTNLLDKKKRLSISVEKKSLRIYLYSDEESIINEINKFISYVFNNMYIGIIGKYNIISPQNLKVYWR